MPSSPCWCQYVGSTHSSLCGTPLFGASSFPLPRAQIVSGASLPQSVCCELVLPQQIYMVVSATACGTMANFLQAGWWVSLPPSVVEAKMIRQSPNQDRSSASTAHMKRSTLERRLAALSYCKCWWNFTTERQLKPAEEYEWEPSADFILLIKKGNAVWIHIIV